MTDRSIAQFLINLQNLDVRLSLVESSDLQPRLRCNAPEGVLTPELRQQLIDRKAELVAFLQQNSQQNSQTISQSVPVHASQTVFPLSFAQQRLWFLYQIAPDNPFYNVPAAIRLSGSLHQGLLERSFQEIVRRHAALRTTFTVVDGEVMQTVLPEVKIALPAVDLRSIAVHDRDRITDQFTTAEAQRPFNLSVDLPIRITLLQFSDAEAILLLTLHHIVADGWSLGLLMRELAELYRAGLEGRSASLAPLPIQYGDFARWQRQWLQDDVLEHQLAYWRRQLQDVSRLDLPIDRPRPAIQTYRGASHPLQFSPELTQAIESLSQQSGLSLFMTLLAAFQTLLHRYTGQTDIAIGSPIANRHRSELEGLIGFFVNSLVLRSDLSGNPTFRELLQQVRHTTLSAYQHQDLPFEKLVEELDPERNLSSNPLFQVAFALQNAPMQPLELPNVRLEPVPLEPQTTRFDLEVHLWQPDHGLRSLWQTKAGLSGFIAYSTDLFDRDTIRRLADHFEILLQGIVANPDRRLSDLPLLQPAERQQLLVDWNQTATDFWDDRGLHHLFEHQAQRTPARIALVTEFTSLSYAAVNEQADRLAQTLRQLGIQSNDLIGLCVDRSADLLIGILGILKAGGAYVPIDPHYPGDRIEFILHDTGMKVLLTQSGLMDKLPRSDAEIICLDRFLAATEELRHSGDRSPGTCFKTLAAPQPANTKGLPNYSKFLNPGGFRGQRRMPNWKKGSETEPDPLHILQPPPGIEPFDASPAIAPDALAYVIYTSGSTGTPKGVMLTHRGLCNVVAAQRQLFDLSDSSDSVRVLQFSSISFDASVFEMALAIAAGGTLYIPPRSAQLPGMALVRFLQEQAITHALLTPAVLAVLPAADLPDLKVLITGGEACPRSVIDRWAANRRFFNAYGPTETTIWATVAELRPGDEPLIGRPVANVQVYVLDDALQPVAIGAIGELYIGGAGVALGYLNRPELASRFIPSPFAPDAKLYRTGDRVRYRASGSLEFCGRSDDQIKIRGFRVEPGEIEAALQNYPAIQEAIVLATGDAVEKRLIAYFTLTQPLIAAQESEKIQTQQIQHWQSLYNQTYQSPASDAAFNITGWNSSYTGEPIPEQEMREWLDDRLQQIRSLCPKRVLEIGCGTGLLLFPIAPHCEAYWGTDFSTVSLETVQRRVEVEKLTQVKLLHRAAIDFTGIESAAFDLVILNSVVQYFPSADYLVQTIAGALQAVRPGGAIFLGDVRSLPLLNAFHAWVSLAQADGTLERAQLQRQVDRSRFEAAELAIDPAFCAALRQAFPKIQRVQIRLARGRSHNEMTQFRYSVLLHVGQENLSNESSLAQALQWIDWQSQPITVEDAKKYLLEHQPGVWGLKNVANDRVDQAVKTAQWLSGQTAPKTVEQFRRSLQNSIRQTIDPQDWWDLETVLPYRVEISWAIDKQTGAYDVVLIRNGIDAEVNFAIDFLVDAQTSPQNDLVNDLSWHRYTNNPLQSQFVRQLIPELRAHLGQILPDYMIPAALIPLESLPLTPNGKIDRAALLEQHEFPVQLAPPLRSANPAFTNHNPTERALIDIWKELLRLPEVDPQQSFFELGGHSLLATQMTSRIRDRFSIELPLRLVFETPTIAQLTPAIDRLRDRTEMQSPPIVRLDRSIYRRRRSNLSEKLSENLSEKLSEKSSENLSENTSQPNSPVQPPAIAPFRSQAIQKPASNQPFFLWGRRSRLPFGSNSTSPVDSIPDFQQTAKARSPLVPLTINGNRSPFFCVHPMFGVVFPYLELAQLLETDSSRSFYGLQPLGLDGKQLPLNRIEAMAAYYIAAMQTIQPHGPYFIGGWSFGGLVAFEMAQQLSQAGETVALLAILDTPAPLTAQQPSLLQSLRFLLKTALWSTLPFLLDYSAIITHRPPTLHPPIPPSPHSPIPHSPAPLLQRWQWSAITRLMPDAQLRLLDESAIVPLLRIFYANSQAAYRYAPQPYAGTVTLFKSNNPADFTSSDPALGWSELCGRVRVHEVPGNHLSMLKPPHVQILAQQLQTYLS